MTERQRKAPNRRKLTDRNVLTLPIKTKPYHVWDERQEGLGVLVRPSGIRTYRCAWNYPNGPTKVFALGRVEDISLDEARRRCAEARRLRERMGSTRWPVTPSARSASEGSSRSSRRTSGPKSSPAPTRRTHGC